ncbi:MAG: hypothetical protein WKG07_44530 [Hymenobacter sp.]
MLAYAAEPPLGAANVLAGVVFSGNNSFENAPLPGLPARTSFVLGSAAGPGPAVVRG